MAKKSSTLARLITSIEVKQVDGTILNVPVGQEDNATANKILITQVRSMVTDAIKTYREKGAVLTPKDLRELAGAARDVADSSNEIYKQGDLPDPSGQPNEKKLEPLADIIDFSAFKPEDSKNSSEDQKE